MRKLLIGYALLAATTAVLAAAVPATTALRWIKSMTDAGLFVRRADPHDGRRVFVELSPGASAAMRGYFAELGKAAA